MDEAIRGILLKKRRTVIMTTDVITHLKLAHHIIYLRCNGLLNVNVDNRIFFYKKIL